MPEKEIDYEKMGQERLTPKQQAMGETRATILVWLNKIDLSEEKRAVVIDYAEAAAGLAGQEIERLQAESPIVQIVRVMEALPRTAHMGKTKGLAGIKTVAEMAEKWRSAVREKEGLAKLQSRQPSQEEIIKSLSQDHLVGSDKFPKSAAVFVVEKAAGQDELITRFLHDLGVLPNGTSINSLFNKLPSHNWNFANKKGAAAINQAIQKNKPTRIHGNRVVGLASAQLPEVRFEVSRAGGNRGLFDVGIWFGPGAIARSIDAIPEV